MTEPAPIPEKRLYRRRLLKAHVKAYLRLGALDMGPNLALSLVDLSEAGACVAVKEAVQPGGAVSVGMEGQSHPRLVVRVGNVVWCRTVEAGFFLVGVAFQKPLPYTTYLDLTQAMPEYAPSPPHAAPPTTDAGKDPHAPRLPDIPT